MMIEIEKPNITIVGESEDGKKGKFVIEPLERGFGTTLGNSLRRVLISSLPGYAVSSIKIDGVLHEMSSLEGVTEDITEIVLNVKGIVAKLHGGETVKTAVIDKKGPCEITAGDINPDADLEIFNPDQIIKAHSGQQFFLRDLTLTIDVSQDTILYSNDVTTRNSLVESINWHNSTSVVTRVDYKGKTAIYLGDTHQISVRNTITPLFRSIYGECEIVQVAHHGYNDTAADILYKYLDVEMVLWPVYRQHLQGLNPDGSYYPNKESQYGGVIFYDFNKNLTKDGIKQVVTLKNLCVVCDDFDTWEFYEKDYVPN